MITRTNPTNVVFVILPLLLRIPVSEGLPEEDQDQDQDVAFLIDLPLDQLLTQKKIFDNTTEDRPPEALPLVSKSPEVGTDINKFHRLPIRKTFYEDDYEDDKDHHHHHHHGSKKKEKSKAYDILNISITALSYLAFGGYLLCMVASALREKRRVYAAYPGTQGNNKFTNVLQQYLTHRPIRIRFPAVTLHGGRKKRRKRSETSPYGYHRRGHPTKEESRGVVRRVKQEEEEEEDDSFSIINAIDYFEILSRIADGGV